MRSFILDTDHITLYREEHPVVRVRVAAVPKSQLAVTIVSFEEQVRGWLALIRRAKNEARTILAYQRLRETLEYFTQVRVLDFDVGAASTFRQLRKQRIRIGTQDLRIAAIALANDCIVVTRNQRDFERVPNLVIEDWSVIRPTPAEKP